MEVFHKPGTMPSFKDHVNSVENTWQSWGAHTFSNLLHIPSGPTDFLTLTLVNTILTSSLFIVNPSYGDWPDVLFIRSDMFRLWSTFSYLQKKSFRLFEKVRRSPVVIDDWDCPCEFSPVSVFRPFHVSATFFDLNRFSIFVLYFRLPSFSSFLSFAWTIFLSTKLPDWKAIFFSFSVFFILFVTQGLLFGKILIDFFETCYLHRNECKMW